MSLISYVPGLALFAFVASATPGPNNVLLLASGVKFGFSRTVPHIIGITIGVTTMIVLTGLGFSELMERFPRVAQGIKIVGAVYFLYLAFLLARSGATSTDVDLTKRPFSLFEALLFQWVNPKAWIFATTAIAAYTSEEAPYLSIALVAVVFAVVNMPSIAIWALFGSKLQNTLQNQKTIRVVNIAMAVILVVSLYPVLLL